MSRARHSARASGSSLAATRIARPPSRGTPPPRVFPRSRSPRTTRGDARGQPSARVSASFHRFALAADTTSAASPRHAARPPSRGSAPHRRVHAPALPRRRERLLGRVRPRERESRGRGGGDDGGRSVKASDARGTTSAPDGSRASSDVAPARSASRRSPTRRIFQNSRGPFARLGGPRPWPTIWGNFLVHLTMHSNIPATAPMRLADRRRFLSAGRVCADTARGPIGAASGDARERPPHSSRRFRTDVSLWERPETSGDARRSDGDRARGAGPRCVSPRATTRKHR